MGYVLRGCLFSVHYGEAYFCRYSANAKRKLFYWYIGPNKMRFVRRVMWLVGKDIWSDKYACVRRKCKDNKKNLNFDRITLYYEEDMHWKYFNCWGDDEYIAVLCQIDRTWLFGNIYLGLESYMGYCNITHKYLIRWGPLQQNSP